MHSSLSGRVAEYLGADIAREEFNLKVETLKYAQSNPKFNHSSVISLFSPFGLMLVCGRDGGLDPRFKLTEDML